MHFFGKIALLAVFCLSPIAWAGEKPVKKESPVKNESVQFSIAVKEKALKPGTKGTLVVGLKPKSGLHINLNPPMSAKLDSNTAFTLAGSLNAPAMADNAQYFDASKKIEQQFEVVSTAKPGKAMVKGVFSYYYCSDAEGWCSKFKQPFEVAVTVAK